MHPELARDPAFVAMFLDEARLAARIQHPNVASVIDAVISGGELFLVMDYVQGESLVKILSLAHANKKVVPIALSVGVVVDMLRGLHAAHEARSEHGEPLCIVHRDVSPQNVLVGADGVARLLDFGIAKAAQSASVTRKGEITGKLRYASPEQVTTGKVDRRSDVYSAAVVLWEALTGKRFFPKLETPQLLAQILGREHVRPSAYRTDVPPQIDAIVLKGLARARDDRWASAKAMADELEQALRLAMASEIGTFVTETCSETLAKRARMVSRVEATPLPALQISEPSQKLEEVEPNPVGVDIVMSLTPPPRSSLRRWASLSGIAFALLGAVTIAFAVAAPGTSDAPRAPAAGAAPAIAQRLPSSTAPIALPSPITSDTAPAMSSISASVPAIGATMARAPRSPIGAAPIAVSGSAAASAPAPSAAVGAAPAASAELGGGK